MRIDGKGNVYIRFSGGKLQFVNELDNTVIASLDTDDNELKPNILRVAEESHLVGRNFFADGELLAGADELNDAGRYGRNQKIFVGSLSSAAAADDIVFSWENGESRGSRGQVLYILCCGRVAVGVGKPAPINHNKEAI
jgi:hypothetical protein